MSLSRTAFRIAALVLAVPLLAACGNREPIKLGFISGQTGPFSDLGGAGLNGAILAVEKRNQAGGSSRRQVKLIIRDDEHNPERARQAFQELVKEGVAAVVGPMTSAMASELLDDATREKTLLMGGTVVTSKVSGKDDYFFRAIAATPYYAAYSAGTHAARLNPRRVTVVFDAANRDYAENWARDYAAELQRLAAIRVDVRELDSRRTTDLAPLAAAILDGKPDLVTFACSARTSASLMRLLRARNGDIRFATSAWAANRLLPEIGDRAVEGALVEQYHNLGDTSPAYRSFADDYRKRFGLDPDYAAVIAYDATNIVMDGLQENPKREGLRETLLRMKKFRGLQAEIELDAFGDARRPAFTTELRQGRFAPIE